MATKRKKTALAVLRAGSLRAEMVARDGRPPTAADLFEEIVARATDHATELRWPDRWHRAVAQIYARRDAANDVLGVASRKLLPALDDFEEAFRIAPDARGGALTVRFRATLAAVELLRREADTFHVSTQFTLRHNLVFGMCPIGDEEYPEPTLRDLGLAALMLGIFPKTEPGERTLADVAFSELVKRSQEAMNEAYEQMLAKGHELRIAHGSIEGRPRQESDL